MDSTTLKAQIDTDITNKVGSASITKGNVGNNMKAVVDYTDQEVATREITTNKSIDVVTDGASDTKYPSVKAVKTYVDAAAGGVVKTSGAVEADNVSLYQELSFDLNTVTTTGASDKVVLPTTTEIGKIVLVFAANNGAAFSVRADQAGTSKISSGGISSTTTSLSVAANASYRFIHLGGGYWKAETM